MAKKIKPRNSAGKNDVSPNPADVPNPPQSSNEAAPGGQDYPQASLGAGFPIVGIGASAGGLSALTEVLRPMATDSPAILVVQHLDPQHKSHLAELVARKTANVVLGTWFHKNVGVVVDTHVTRISRRWELTKNTEAPKIEQDLMKVIPQEKWTLFSHQVIWHGRALCVARRPKCVDCSLENICHAGDKTWSTVDIHKNAK